MTTLFVPDIGDFKDVEVIEVLVKVGDAVVAEQSLITVESDKASMEIPCPSAGVVEKLLVQVGSKISQGTPMIELKMDAPEASSLTAKAQPPADPPKPPAEKASSPTPTVSQPAQQSEAKSTYQGQVDVTCDLLVLGAGPGGYSAAFRAADLGMNVVLVERYPTLGGVCLNVGCIPSKALLHTAGVLEEALALSKNGIEFAAPKINLETLRQSKQKVVSKLTGGLAGMAKMRKVNILRGLGRFIDAFHMQATDDAGLNKIIEFKQAIIAAGSQSVKLPFMPADPRVVDSTGALELPQIPKRMLVIGGGIIGLEMATVYSALGSCIDIVEMMDGLMLGADRDLVKVWQKMNQNRFDHVMLNTNTLSAKAGKKGIEVSFAAAQEGGKVEQEKQTYDLVLMSVGRTPNGKNIGAEAAGVKVSDPGFIAVDNQMRTNISHIFAIGDIIGQPMLAHKAVHEGHVAAEVAAGHKAYFDARIIPSVAYTDPEVAWVGITEEEAKNKSIAIKKALFPWAASGRAIANGRDEGFTKLLFDAETERILGGGIVGTHAGDLIGEIALAIEMGADSVDIGHTIHPHPTLCESIGLAAEALHGACTDLPPIKR